MAWLHADAVIFLMGLTIAFLVTASLEQRTKKAIYIFLGISLGQGAIGYIQYFTGIPEAEKQRLVSGVAAQYESEVVYHSIREDLEKLGVLFLDTDTALREHEELFREYFGTVIPVGDNKFAALNTSVWSGGSFIGDDQGALELSHIFSIDTEICL